MLPDPCVLQGLWGEGIGVGRGLPVLYPQVQALERCGASLVLGGRGRDLGIRRPAEQSSS